MSTPNAGWPLPLLLNVLQRRGWGPDLVDEVAGVVRVLEALRSRLDWNSAQGRTTVEQIAAAARMSERWTRHCLERLEALGIITWTRGGLRAGRPVPSWIRMSKAALVALIESARTWRALRLAAHYAARTKRVAETLRNPTQLGKTRQNPLSHHAELGSTPPISEVPAPAPGTFKPATNEGNGMPTCAICGRDQATCRRLDAKVAEAIRHDFKPGLTPAQQRTMPADKLRPPVSNQLKQGWRALVSRETSNGQT